MSDLKICRICLCKGVKLYEYDRYYLKQYYEEVMAKKVKESDSLPRYFCYVCAAILYKFHKFKEKCHTGEKTLQELICSEPVTQKLLSQINKHINNSQPPLAVMSVNKRVRTYIVKNKTLPTINNIDEVVLPVIEEAKLAYDSDTDNKSLLEIKNEMNNEEIENIVPENKTFKEKVTEDTFVADLEDDGIFCEDDLIDSLQDVKEELLEDIAVDKHIDNNTTLNINEDLIKSEDELKANKNKERKKKNKLNKDIIEKKPRKFEVCSSKVNYLDSNNWLKINLTEEEAIEEFKARAQDKKYLAAAYHCTDCYKGFTKEDMLKRHKILRHSESIGPVECRFCSMRFKWKCYLSRHIKQHYTKFKCLRCNLVCPLITTALLHNDYHNGVKKQCEHCGEEFRHLSSYYTHMRTHRSEYLCTLCGASFVSTMGLNMHKRSMHVNTVVTPEGEVDTYCARCDIKFETLLAYQEHVNHSAKHTEDIEDMEIVATATSIPRRKKKARQRRQPRKLTACEICDRIFPSEAKYLKHRTSEHKDTPRREIRHICEICGASLAMNSISSHLNTHTRQKTYTCDTCQMQFNSKGSMTRHQLTHTGEKPHKCSLCEKRFTQKSSMQLHYRTFHLKEPYPKRFRKKKSDLQRELEDYRMNDDDSDENQKVNRWR